MRRIAISIPASARSAAKAAVHRAALDGEGILQAQARREVVAVPGVAAAEVVSSPVLVPTRNTQTILNNLAKLATQTQASGFLRRHLADFVTQAGYLTVLDMRARVQGKPGITDTTRLSRELRLGNGAAPSLTDTGGLAQVLSFRWRSWAKLQLDIGPVGGSDLSRRFGLGTIAAVEQPPGLSFTELAGGSGSGQEGPARQSKMSYAELAWLHELGYAFRPTDKMVAFFKKLAWESSSVGGFTLDERGRKRLNWTTPAARMLGLISETKRMTREVNGNTVTSSYRVPKDIVITVPARPFMAPAMEFSMVFLRNLFPDLTRQVFGNWVAGTMPRSSDPQRAMEGRVWADKDPGRRFTRKGNLRDLAADRSGVLMLKEAFDTAGGERIRIPLRGAAIPARMPAPQLPSYFVTFGAGFGKGR